MQRLKWPFFIAFTLFVFSSGVLCGMYFSPAPSLAPLVEKQTAASRGPLADSAGADVFALKRQAPPSLRSASQADGQSAREKAAQPKPATPPVRQGKAAATATPRAGDETASLPVSGEVAPASPAPQKEERFAGAGTRQAGTPQNAATTEKQAPGVVASAAPQADPLPFKPNPFSFTLRKLGPGSGDTLMVVGGIQGDEPGGFSAASLIATHYTIKRGSVWVVPDLNISSILGRSRGVYGDMNRKFAALDTNDPDFKTIQKIKSVLLDNQVSLILNLHDGSGFYRPEWEDSLRNPKRWGQSLIIDQKEMDAPRFNRLYETASLIGNDVNTRLLDPNHRYHIYNTYTSDGNEEMAKTLSYFAVCNGKPAFGIEASKEIRPEYRTYYHLQVIEAFMRHMGIEYERDFPLTPGGVMSALNSNLKVSVYNNRLVLPLENIRPNVNMLPFKKNAMPDVRASKPLLTLVPDPVQKGWRVAYGNRTLTRVQPDFMEFDYSLETLEMELDGKPYTVRMGELVSVNESFLVKGIPGFRVNAIGAQKEVNGSESDVLLVREDFMPRFSVDRDASIYRVEVYRGKAFAGMVLVSFDDAGTERERPLTAIGGTESSLGF